MVPRFICASNATERICLMNIVPTSRATTSSSAVPTRAHSVSNFRTARRVFEGRIKTERQRTRGRLNSRTNASRQVCMAAYGEDEDLYSVLGVPKDADGAWLEGFTSRVGTSLNHQSYLRGISETETRVGFIVCNEDFPPGTRIQK